MLAAQILAFSGIAVQQFSPTVSERSAFLLTSRFVVNQPILTSSAGRAKAGGGPRTLR